MNNYNNSRKYHSRGGKVRSDFATVLLFYVLPFIVVNLLIFFLVTTKPKCIITVSDTADYLTTNVTIKIKSFLPTSEPEATLDGEEVKLIKDGKNTYSVILQSNGILEVDLTSLNKMKTATFEHISILDDNPPLISDNTLSEDGILSFRLEDSQSGVDYSSIYGLDADGDRLMPLTIDRSTNTVSFEMKTDSLQVFIKDLSGNEVRANFNPQGDNLEEDAKDAAGEDQL